MDGKLRHYTPDFYLPEYDVLLEVKGHWWGRDREKMDIVLKTHTDKNIVIVEKEHYEKILQGDLHCIANNAALADVVIATD